MKKTLTDDETRFKAAAAKSKTRLPSESDIAADNYLSQLHSSSPDQTQHRSTPPHEQDLFVSDE